MTYRLYVVLGFFLFFTGFWGVFFNRRHIFIMLMSIELMLLAINFLFIVNAYILDDAFGSVARICVLSVAACESALGFGLIVLYARTYPAFGVDALRNLRS